MLISSLHGANPPLPEHKNPDFVLEKPENEGSKPKKSTKTSILCSEDRKVASGIVKVAFLQITAHTFKT